MMQRMIAFRKFVQVGTHGGRTQIFGADDRGNLIAGEIVARCDRQAIANVVIGLEPTAIMIECYPDGMPDYTVRPPAMGFVVTMIPWDVWKVVRVEGGTRWEPADAGLNPRVGRSVRMEAGSTA